MKSISICMILYALQNEWVYIQPALITLYDTKVSTFLVAFRTLKGLCVQRILLFCMRIYQKLNISLRIKQCKIRGKNIVLVFIPINITKLYILIYKMTPRKEFLCFSWMKNLSSIIMHILALTCRFKFSHRCLIIFL